MTRAALAALSLHPIEARLPVSHGNARDVWHERAGLIVRLEAEGRVGIGEASPLPGRSIETAAQSRAALEALGDHFSLPDLTLGQLPELPELPAAARFALETAILDWLCQREGVPLAAWLKVALNGMQPGGSLAPPDARVECQVLCDRLDDVTILERVPEATAIKVKIGRPHRMAEENAQLRRIRALRPSIVLRADANGVEVAPDQLDVLVEVGCALLEDPAPFDAIEDDWPMPIAIDEHLTHDPRAVLAAVDRWQVMGVVLKPTLLGGLQQALRIGSHAHVAGATSIVSHAFESPVGMAAAAHAALALGAFHVHGLARWDGLSSFTIGGVPIAAPDWIGPSAITLPSTAGLGVPFPAS